MVRRRKSERWEGQTYPDRASRSFGDKGASGRGLVGLLMAMLKIGFQLKWMNDCQAR